MTMASMCFTMNIFLTTVNLICLDKRGMLRREIFSMPLISTGLPLLALYLNTLYSPKGTFEEDEGLDM